MPTPSEQLLSRTIYDVDGFTTVWDFSFTGGYLDPSHVKAYTEAPNAARVPISVTAEMLIGEFQLQITPALTLGAGVLVIYRDTPKDLPMVDFVEGPLSEIALDTNAKQAVFIAAETLDELRSSSSDLIDNAAVNAIITAALVAKLDATHAGTGGTAHANAGYGGAAGFMTGAQSAKLDGVAAGATVNSSDAALRDRSTHTGTQLAGTISDFAATVMWLIGDELALLAPRLSPELLGTPTTPTAAPGTATGQIASTAFVAAAMGALPPAPGSYPTTWLDVSVAESYGWSVGPFGARPEWGVDAYNRVHLRGAVQQDNTAINSIAFGVPAPLRAHAWAVLDNAVDMAPSRITLDETGTARISLVAGGLPTIQDLDGIVFLAAPI